MKKEISIAFVGAGNLATNLAKALHQKGFRIAQVYSRTEESAQALASAVHSEWTTELSRIVPDATLYIVALKDSALIELLPQIVEGKQNKLWVHTAGSLPIDIWTERTTRYGVFYPLQTFSKLREVDFHEIPFFIEANRQEDAEWLKTIASALSRRVYAANSEQRKSLHLAAVFACNFTNHLYVLASDLLKKYGLPFDAILPLIDETARKVHDLSPSDAQTGPAIRYDENVIGQHLDMLSGDPDMQELYRMLTESIHRRSQQNEKQIK